MMSEAKLEPGLWAVVTGDRFSGLSVRQIAKVTPKLVNFDGQRWPRRAEHRQVLLTYPDQKSAEHAKQSLDGIRGEYDRRKQAAHDAWKKAHNTFLTKAREQ